MLSLNSLANDSSANDRPTEKVFSFRIAMIVSALLLSSGFVHLAILATLGTTWHGPLSLRKPALFGVSGGMTIWSIAWLMIHLKPNAFDRLLINLLSIALFIEVTLITLQYWRGVPSHFNHSTSFDAAIEFTMLGLILFVTGGIFYLTWRTFRLRTMDPAMAIAIRGGMGLLALSCLLGIVTSVLGEISLSAGRSYELWGRAGVLKFPHGVALHAIQTLPIVAWLARLVSSNRSVCIVQSILVAQVLFLFYALWQTGNGRDRFDWDLIGGSILGIVILLSLYSSFALARGFVKNLRPKTK